MKTLKTFIEFSDEDIKKMIMYLEFSESHCEQFELYEMSRDIERYKHKFEVCYKERGYKI